MNIHHLKGIFFLYEILDIERLDIEKVKFVRKLFNFSINFKKQTLVLKFRVVIFMTIFYIFFKNNLYYS